jgi:hypothetical protein
MEKERSFQRWMLMLEVLRELYSQPCELADVCPHAKEACRKPVEYDPERMRAIPTRRWIDCDAYMVMLGLVFIKELGVHHLAECPKCGCNLIEVLKENLRRIKHESLSSP